MSDLVTARHLELVVLDAMVALAVGLP